MGPVLSDCISNDKDKKELSSFLYNSVLVPINTLIEQEKYEDACEKYYVMTLSLINYYGLKHPYNSHVDNDYGYVDNFDRESSGHGYKKILTKNC